jgi:hypothetical protein
MAETILSIIHQTEKSNDTATIRKKRTSYRLPVKELTTGREFFGINDCAAFFYLSYSQVAGCLNGKILNPKHPYKFEWIVKKTLI